ncbi:hypothetical protein AAG906_009811 [Vitis piasezkii]
MLKLVNTFGMDEVELYIEQVSAPVAMTYECRVDADEKKCESQEGDDQTLHEAMESEQGRYVFVDGKGCDVSNNSDPEDPMEFSLVQYHSAPSL